MKAAKGKVKTMSHNFSEMVTDYVKSEMANGGWIFTSTRCDAGSIGGEGGSVSETDIVVRSVTMDVVVLGLVEGRSELE